MCPSLCCPVLLKSHLNRGCVSESEGGALQCSATLLWTESLCAAWERRMNTRSHTQHGPSLKTLATAVLSVWRTGWVHSLELFTFTGHWFLAFVFDSSWISLTFDHLLMLMIKDRCCRLYSHVAFWLFLFLLIYVNVTVMQCLHSKTVWGFIITNSIYCDVIYTLCTSNIIYTLQVTLRPTKEKHFDHLWHFFFHTAVAV